LKEGRTGTLVFVLVRHEISNATGIAITEEHDIVYRGEAGSAAMLSAPLIAPPDPVWERAIHAGDVLLFRYSALTFNGHRIHYDRRYATEVERYPGLVVHGPLLATLLVDLLRRNLPGAVLTRFDFRALRPVFDTADFSVCGSPAGPAGSIHLWVKDPNGGLAVDATATVAAEPSR
jgi:3-methylfumaryl-CoA hydratase